MIYFVAAQAGRRSNGRLPDIALERAHAVEVMALLPPLGWFVVIWWKRSLGVADAVILLALYAAYLWVLWQCPPTSEEALEEAPAVSRWAYGLGGNRRLAAIGGLFAGGGVLLYLTAHPFLESMLGLAATLGVSQFFFVQWIAPFLSEFPEGLSTFTWARRRKGPMALMNLVSSNINQWTVLAAMIPVLFGWSHLRAHGSWVPFTFDGAQQTEIALTITQSMAGALLLMRMRISALDASTLLALWLAQFLVPSWRGELTVVYLVWCAGMILLFVSGRRECAAPRVFVEVLRENRRRLKAES